MTVEEEGFDHESGADWGYDVVYTSGESGFEPERVLRRKKYPPNPDADVFVDEEVLV